MKLGENVGAGPNHEADTQIILVKFYMVDI